MGLWRLLYVLILIHQAKAQNGTSFGYPTFPYNEIDDFLRNNVYFSGTGFWINRNNYTSNDCGSFLYGEPIQMRGSNSSAVASFSTSFTFSTLGKNSAGFAFVFLPQNRTLGKGGGQLCLSDLNEAGDSSTRFFAVEFDTWKNPEFNDPSNNHVGVNINSMNSSATHNLCGGGIDNCSYLVYNQTSVFDPGYNFTSWIDYDSGAQSLAVFLANGTTMRGVKKPASAIIQVSVNLSDVMNENMFVGFTGSAAAYKEVKQFKSWSFNTSFTQTEGSPTLGLSNNASAPGNIAPAPSIGGSGRKELIAKVAGGIVGGLLVIIIIIYKVNKLFRRPLHFFISLTGGEDQKYRNFAKSLYRKITESWTLNCCIDVFMDSKRLEMGKSYIPPIMQALEKTEVGIVVVTPEYFTKKWPMTELISFMKSQDKNSDVRILPLFYGMPVSDVRDILEIAKLLQVDPEQVNLGQVKMEQVNNWGQVKMEQVNNWGQAWNKAWNKRACSGKHPIPFEDCRDAVERLRTSSGIVYKFTDKCYDDEYIDLIVKEVGKIVRTEIWNRVVGCCLPSKLKCK